MSNFYVKDGHDTIVDIAGANVLHSIPSVRKSLDYTKGLQEYMWETRRITNHGTYFGDPNYQWLMHVPGKLVAMLDKKQPGWDTDEDALRKIAYAQPGVKVNPEEFRG